MKKQRHIETLAPGLPACRAGAPLRSRKPWPGQHQVAPSDLWQLIRLHKFFTKTTHIDKHQKSMKRVIQFKQTRPVPKRFGRSGILIILLLACFSLLQQAQAVVPPPDGGYPGFNTAEGQGALLSLDTSTGLANTAVGWFSLKSNVDTSFNTGVGAGTLLLNTGDENTATGAGALLSNTTGTGNTANGAFALFFNTTGLGDTAIGRRALFSNTTGNFNTANGSDALFSNTEGNNNTATGVEALYNNTTGANNSAFGVGALSSNTTGGFNTASGNSALASNTEGENNTATGVQALFSNATGSENSAFGAGTLASNTVGAGNTAVGKGALNQNTEGGFNTAVGPDALGSNTTGTDNTAAGDGALYFNTTGQRNTATGAGALVDNTTGSDNTAIGNRSLENNTTGNNNVALGASAGDSVTTANNVIAIGHPGANVDNSCYIGNIFGANVDPGAVFVVVDANGKLGTTASSRRFKEEIQPMDQASEALLSLKPVTFRYKNYKSRPRQFGLIAEEVAAVNPDLVARDKNGDIYTVRYDQINAMLLNEFLKEHKKVQEQQECIADLNSRVATQETTTARQQEGMAALTAQLKQQAEQIQKVSAQIEIGKSAPQAVVTNDR